VKSIAKLTGALKPSVRVEGYYVSNGQDTGGANAGPLVRPEAIANGDRSERIWSGRLLWTVRPTRSWRCATAATPPTSSTVLPRNGAPGLPVITIS
jgi:hypothetical protein